MSLLIRNCRIVSGNGLVQADILIENGKIKDINSSIDENADKIIDANSNIAIPGIIDPHTHLREPGQEYKEDFLTGTRAAAAGGITTILDMPNNKPPILTIRELDNKRRLAEKSVVNYGFHFGSGENNLEEIKSVKSISSVKVFMDDTTGDMKIADDSVLQEVFQNSKIVSVHAEGEKVRKAISMIKNTDNLLYLCHISTKEELEIIKREKDSQVFVEAAPHHLFLTKNDIDELKGFGMMKPGLRSEQDREALWEALSNGLIDAIGTDHAPHTIKEKQSENPPFGVPGLETVLPLLLNAVNEKRLTLSKLVQLTSANPAKIFRIQHKGKLEKGYDADIVIIDLNLEKQVRNKELYTKCGWSPFNGKILKGWPITTIVNGEIIYNDQKINDHKSYEVKYFE